jgi:hypothetical protein
LEDLTFGDDFNQPISNSLDKLTQLKNLTFGYYFNQPIEGLLVSLTKLEYMSIQI